MEYFGQGHMWGSAIAQRIAAGSLRIAGLGRRLYLFKHEVSVKSVIGMEKVDLCITVYNTQCMMYPPVNQGLEKYVLGEVCGDFQFMHIVWTCNLDDFL